MSQITKRALEQSLKNLLQQKPEQHGDRKLNDARHRFPAGQIMCHILSPPFIELPNIAQNRKMSIQKNRRLKRRFFGVFSL